MSDAARGWTHRLRHWARVVKRDALTLWYASRHPGTPLIAKILSACLVAYAVSPIDLIPDFIPVLGLLDDAIILPLGILFVIHLVPATVLDECRRSAADHLERGLTRPTSWVGAAAVLIVWAAVAVLGYLWVRNNFDFP